MNEIDIKQLDHHKRHYQEILDKGDIDGFINPNSFWYWEHVYCLEHISDFFKKISPSVFLTIGDGYCGREGAFIKRFGHFVHASDIEICLLEEAWNRGLIDEYSIQDVNNLDFLDGSFDYIFTKETLHHLSTPYRGLYEMFRVAKKGVIIIEPNGDNERRYQYNKFEEVGNYMYGFSSHELVKAGLAYGFKFFVVTYSIVFFLFHSIQNINDGRIEEEKGRLIEYDNKFEHVTFKPLLIVFFLKEEKDWNIFNDDNKFVKIRTVNS